MKSAYTGSPGRMANKLLCVCVNKEEIYVAFVNVSGD